MIHEFWLLLLPVAALSGWLTASVHREKDKNISLPGDYLLGLNFLLNEEPDKALDVFIKMLEIDSETVETHLALGNLFRRRGEVDRAIRIHQNLIARPTLNKIYRAQALLALAEDYLSAGVLDRAERLFLELIKLGDHITISLKRLLNIYEQEHEWQKAINIAKKLVTSSTENISTIIAHYHCELAQAAIDQGLFDQAKRLLKKAMATDKSCVRASLLLANMEIASNRHRHAIRHLKRIKIQNPDFISEAVLLLVQSFRALNKEEELVEYLKDIVKEFPSMPIAIILSEQIKHWRGSKAAISFVADHVRRYPSILGLHRLIELRLSSKNDDVKDDLTTIHALTQKLLDEFPPYQCMHCGFSSKTLHWQCPTCQEWNSVKLTDMTTKF